VHSMANLLPLSRTPCAVCSSRLTVVLCGSCNGPLENIAAILFCGIAID
jgi:hypothetical protein